MTSLHKILTPPPASLRVTGASVPIAEELTYSFSEGSLPAPAQHRVETSLGRRGRRLQRRDVGEAQLRIELDSNNRGLAPQGYELTIQLSTGAGSSHSMLLVARTHQGISYGLTTLSQIILTAPSDPATGNATDNESAAAPPFALELPTCSIKDKPALENRGVMLDISRNRVPKQSQLFELIDRLAALKINHLQLYMEHTFAYRGHEEVWRHDSPLTAEEVQEIDAYCRLRHIELAPNQNSFGHFHRWLVHERYRPLAEVPEGVEHPFGPEPEPFSLCATDPSTFDLLADLYDQLLPNFTSETFNVGLDETFDLGLGRSAAACALKGKHRVYLEYLQKVHTLVADRDRRMQYWGDIVLEHPSIVRELPRDATALLWGYERNHPFEEQCPQFAEADVDFWVCPGTSSWLSFGGRARNCLGNIQAAADSANRHGASGLLVTDWGDWGHIQPPFVSALGFCAGAAHAWNPTTSDARRTADWQKTLDTFWFDDQSGALSATAVGLANVYRETDTPNVNASVLFSAFRFLDDDLTSPRYRRLSNASLTRTSDAIQTAIDGVRDHKSRRSDAALLVTEMEWISNQMLLAVDLLRARLASGERKLIADMQPSVRGRLGRRLYDQWLRFEPLWHERSRPGGLRRTRRLFERWESRLQAHD